MKKIALLLTVALVFSAMSLYAQTAQTHLDNGKRLFDQGNYDGAIQELTEAIRLDPNMAEAYAYRGAVSYYIISDNDSALSDANRAIQLNPRLAMGYYARGNAYIAKNDDDRAIVDYTEAIRLDPSYVNAYNNRGGVYLLKNDYDRAIVDYTEAIRLEPTAARYNRRGSVYSAKMDYDRAIADYTEVIRLEPTAASYNTRGVAYENKKDYDRALADYTEAIRLDRNYARAYTNRGDVYSAKNDYDRAIADYEAALRINPNDSNAKSNLAKVQSEKARGPFDITNSALGGVKITRYNGTQTEVVIPATIDGARVTEIGDYSFAIARGASPTENRTGVVTLKSVVFPSSLIAIGEAAFLYQPLTSITFPASLRTIGFGAFQGNKFTSVVIPNGVKFVDKSAFMSDTITSVTIPASLATFVYSELNPARNEGFRDAFRGERSPFVPNGMKTNINRITLPANVDPRNFDSFYNVYIFQGDSALRDAYVGNGRKAGTYVWTGRIWRVE